MIERNSYVERIVPFIGKPIIKVITGIRRCGKSSVLQLIQNYCVENGISSEESMLFINMESMRYSHIRTGEELYKEVIDFIKPGKRTLLFVDEIQQIEGWEKAVVSLLSDNYADIFITGSNAKLLSSELATRLAGRYVSFSVFPLTYSEFLEFQNEKPSQEQFRQFCTFGGLPGIHHFPLVDDVVFQYISDVFDSIVLKDIILRNSVRNTALLEKLMQFILANIGSIFSANSVSSYFKKEQRAVGAETIYNYLDHLQSAYIIHKVPRYDIQGKRFLEVQEKYYVGDIGLRNGLLGYRHTDISGILENIVFLELLKRGYSCSIGKIDTKEIDFIARKQNKTLYIQVAMTLGSPETVEREYSVLEMVPDNYPKLVLSLDPLFQEDRNGIMWRNLAQFLLSYEF